jgi:hypothetical protein
MPPQAAGELVVETGLAPSQTPEQLWVVLVLGRADLQAGRKPENATVKKSNFG